METLDRVRRARRKKTDEVEPQKESVQGADLAQIPGTRPQQNIDLSKVWKSWKKKAATAMRTNPTYLHQEMDRR